MLRPNTVFCCHRNEIIARLKEDFGYETRLPLTGPIPGQSLVCHTRPLRSTENVEGCIICTMDWRHMQSRMEALYAMQESKSKEQ